MVWKSDGVGGVAVVKWWKKKVVARRKGATRPDILEDNFGYFCSRPTRGTAARAPTTTEKKSYHRHVVVFIHSHLVFVFAPDRRRRVPCFAPHADKSSGICWGSGGIGVGDDIQSHRQHLSHPATALGVGLQ
jgi:hypothetical protein